MQFVEVVAWLKPGGAVTFALFMGTHTLVLILAYGKKCLTFCKYATILTLPVGVLCHVLFSNMNMTGFLLVVMVWLVSWVFAAAVLVWLVLDAESFHVSRSRG